MAAPPPRWPTDGTTTFAPTTGPDGEPIFVLLAKRSYSLQLNGQWAPASPVPLRAVDEYFGDGDPQTHSVRLEAEMAPFKPTTDFVVVASAWAPGLRPTPQFDASVAIGAVRKTIRIFGDRRCVFRPGLNPRVTDPEPVVDREMRYELAYGGIDLKSDPPSIAMYPRNPLGRGYALRNISASIEGLPLPNFEDPTDLLVPERIVVGEPDRWPAQPLPQGFGWFPKIAYPRCSFVGSIPAFLAPGTTMKEEALGLIPPNQIALAKRFRLPSYDVRFNRGASFGLALSFLEGGETVRLTNLSPDGALAFTLPREKPQLALDIGRGPTALAAVMHTACVRVEEGKLEIVWRGSMGYPGIDWLPEMKKLIPEVVWP